MKDQLTPHLPSNEQQDKQFLFAAFVAAVLVMSALLQFFLHDILVSIIYAIGFVVLIATGTLLMNSKARVLHAVGALAIIVVISGAMAIVK